MNPPATLYRRQGDNIGSEVENSTIEKQRKELQLLIGELKDRDKELNDMVAVHQRQLLSWEEDRQKVLTLEERCSKLEGELHKRTDIIKSLMRKVKTLESNQTECQTALQKTQQQLQEMAQKATHSALLSEDLEARNENLSSTLVDLSAQVGQLQAREQALTTMIKLKDKDIIEAVNHISDCSGKFKLLEHALRDAKMAETCVVKEKQDYKQKLKALRIEVSKLKEDLNEKTTENNEQREEIIRLKQEKSCLHDELIFTDNWVSLCSPGCPGTHSVDQAGLELRNSPASASQALGLKAWVTTAWLGITLKINKHIEREKRKDELLDIAKSKQDRTNSELHNLRQIYVKQQSDLQFLNFNVENSQELIQIHGLKMEEPKALECSRDMCLSDLDNNYPKIDIKREKNQKSLVKDQKFEVTLAQHNRSDKSSCDACREKKLQVNTAFGEKSVIGLSSLFTKDLLEKQKSWSLGGKIQTEPENTVTLCKVHAKSPKCNGVALQMEEKQLSETSLADESQWHDINVYLGLSSCSIAKQPDKPGGDCHDPTETSEVSYCTQNEVCIGDSDLSESKCCHPSNIIIEAPGQMTDTEWMNIFKPSKAQRIVRHKTLCTCSRSVSAMKYNCSARGIDTGVFVQEDVIDSNGEFPLRAASEAEVLLKSRASYEPGKDVLLENKQVGHSAEWNAALEHSSPGCFSSRGPDCSADPRSEPPRVTPHATCTAPLFSKYDVKDRTFVFNKLTKTGELLGIRPSQCLGSVKSSGGEDEAEALPDRRTSSSEKDDFSPTSKLQRLLAESRQMVTDLELSTLLPISCESLNRNRISLCSPEYPGTHRIDQVSLEFRALCLPLPLLQVKKLEVSEDPDEKPTLVSH
ncbi:Coiled-coil domain-containing protein 62 [Apodemus speciosus]|uniref:Coiled-coil domain-containing protein 62 n=1 Tax=Apodemus speciosus TaxID=105296 RepID=A0ABQ0ETA1_APOSI